MEVDKSELLSVLKKNILFQNNSDQFLIKFLYCGEILDCSSNQIIIEEGALGDTIYFIMNGTCAVSKRGENGQEIYISTLDAGKHFGEAGVFVEGVRTANVKSLEDVLLLTVSKKQMDQIINTNPDEGIILLKKIIQENFNRLKDTTHELRFERRKFVNQSAIDDILAQL